MQLPEEFISSTRRTMGEERFARLMAAFGEEPPVSIRLNPMKTSEASLPRTEDNAVPWCEHGRYLQLRPVFTFDPLLHAGCYYVQEAASMFVHHIVSSYLPTLSPKGLPIRVLDLCAAPGGKSTALRAVLPKDSVLVSNEPIRSRASILLENITKWGYPNCIVTTNYPRDFRKAGLMFDLILCDVPCSGEGMFRRDEATIGEWSTQNVERCWQLQRDIVGDAWQCLRPGGLLIYSTCTFNIKENEENVRWMQQELEAEVLPVETRPEWGITGSLLEGFHEPVYRFIPGLTRSEGLFVACLRHASLEGATMCEPKHADKAFQRLNVLTPPAIGRDSEIKVDLSYTEAIAYLRHEAIVLPPDVPRGLVTVCFQGHPLGLVKNIGTRANNLYPKEWKIKSTHIPNDYEAILRPA